MKQYQHFTHTQQEYIIELRGKNLSIRRIAEILNTDKSKIQRFVLRFRPQPKSRSDITHLVSGSEKASTTYLDSLKGLDFQQWNNKIGIPKQKKQGLPHQFPFDYEWKVFNELFLEDGSARDRHVAWLASRGLGKSETAIRILCWLATRTDNLRGSEMMLITGNRQALANDLCNRIKEIFRDAYLPDTAANVVNLNGVRTEGYPASGHNKCR